MTTSHGERPIVDEHVRQEWYRSLVASMDQGFCVCEMLVDDAGAAVDYRFLEVSPHFAGMTGIRADAVGRTARELVPGLEDEWIDAYARVGIGGETRRFEQGSVAMGRSFEVLAWPLGERRFAILFQDVTERRRAEAAMHESEERARLAVDMVGLGTWRYDIATDTVSLDDRMREIWALTDEVEADLPLHRALERVHPEDRDSVAIAVSAALDPAGTGVYGIEFRLRWPDGQTRWVMANGQVAFTDDGDGRHATSFIGTALDVTERRRADDALRSSEARLTLTTEAAQVGIWQWDVVSGDVRWSDMHKQQWGLPPGPEPVRYEDWLSAIVPDDRPVAEAAVEAVLERHGPYDVSYRVRPAGKGEERWIRSVGRLRLGADGTPRSLQGISIDITESKRTEEALRESEARLQRALVAKDEFLGFVSHELRTPMTVILGMSRILERGDAGTDRAREVARDIAQSAEVLNGVVESMLLLARIDRDEAAALREPVLLHHTASEVVAQHAARDRSRSYEVDARSRQGLVDVQTTWLVRVIDNLVGNAAKYSAPGRPIRVVVDADGVEATLRVLDEGPGLSDEELTQVFEAFYRAPSAVDRAPGAGLGLAVARRIIELLGGRVWAVAPPEGGAEFGFALPVLVAGDES